MCPRQNAVSAYMHHMHCMHLCLAVQIKFVYTERYAGYSSSDVLGCWLVASTLPPPPRPHLAPTELERVGLLLSTLAMLCSISMMLLNSSESM